MLASEPETKERKQVLIPLSAYDPLNPSVYQRTVEEALKHNERAAAMVLTTVSPRSVDTTVDASAGGSYTLRVDGTAPQPGSGGYEMDVAVAPIISSDQVGKVGYLQTLGSKPFISHVPSLGIPQHGEADVLENEGYQQQIRLADQFVMETFLTRGGPFYKLLDVVCPLKWFPAGRSFQGKGTAMYFSKDLWQRGAWESIGRGAVGWQEEWQFVSQYRLVGLQMSINSFLKEYGQRQWYARMFSLGQDFFRTIVHLALAFINGCRAQMRPDRRIAARPYQEYVGMVLREMESQGIAQTSRNGLHEAARRAVEEMRNNLQTDVDLSSLAFLCSPATMFTSLLHPHNSVYFYTGRRQQTLTADSANQGGLIGGMEAVMLPTYYTNSNKEPFVPLQQWPIYTSYAVMRNPLDRVQLVDGHCREEDWSIQVYNVPTRSWTTLTLRDALVNSGMFATDGKMTPYGLKSLYGEDYAEFDGTHNGIVRLFGNIRHPIGFIVDHGYVRPVTDNDHKPTQNLFMPDCPSVDQHALVGELNGQRAPLGVSICNAGRLQESDQKVLNWTAGNDGDWFCPHTLDAYIALATVAARLVRDIVIFRATQWKSLNGAVVQKGGRAFSMAASRLVPLTEFSAVTRTMTCGIDSNMGVIPHNPRGVVNAHNIELLSVYAGGTLKFAPLTPEGKTLYMQLRNGNLKDACCWAVAVPRFTGYGPVVPLSGLFDSNRVENADDMPFFPRETLRHLAQTIGLRQNTQHDDSTGIVNQRGQSLPLVAVQEAVRRYDRNHHWELAERNLGPLGDYIDQPLTSCGAFAHGPMVTTQLPA